jgi:hypothetical protein
VADELDADVIPFLVLSWNCFHSLGGRDDEQAKQRVAIMSESIAAMTVLSLLSETDTVYQ